MTARRYRYRVVGDGRWLHADTLDDIRIRMTEDTPAVVERHAPELAPDAYTLYGILEADGQLYKLV